MNAVSIHWAPLLPWEVLAVIGALSFLLIAFALFRRARGATWRILALGGLLLALANPSAIEEQREALNDIVFVLVDDSQSQELGPRSQQTQDALAHTLERLEALEGTEVRVIRAGADAIGVEQDGTKLFSALGEALSSVSRQQVSGVIVISDGQIHDVPENFAALGIQAPVHLLLSGEEKEFDRRLTVVQAPGFGIVGQPQSLKLIVEDIGSEDRGGLVELQIRQDGQDPRLVRVPVGVEQEIEFELDRRGPSVLEIEAEPLTGELSLANNRTAISVDGVRDRLRVLLVSGEPHAGERAWRNILKSDPSVDLVHFTILRPPEKQDGTPIRELSLIAFPTRELFELKLDEFDLVIFDRYRRRGVLPSIYLDNIARYVERGGALLEAVGPTFATPLSLYRTPLGRILPVEPTGEIYEAGYRPKVTELGERHPVTATLGGRKANDPPEWGQWFRHISGDSLRGSIVMSGLDDRPLLVLDRVGEGRVAQFMSDHMWLWSRGFDGGGPQAELLRRISHWLMKEPELEEEDLRASVVDGRLEITRRSLIVDNPEIDVVLPSGTQQKVTLEPGDDGVARASIDASEAGLYRISDGVLSAVTAAGPLNPREFENALSSAVPMQALLKDSGGTSVRLAKNSEPGLRKVSPSRDQFGRNWIGIRDARGYVVTGVNQVPLLPAILLLFVLVGGAIAAWFREGH
ncbi:hypothetical protein [Denitrobaculum tricleocarpae]|uniref:Glutamine amidotransferase domain-containing protein n=1 Tax=Denitrobaculum tricleocarpae TaxID=2591009 RepID=A0A545U231_9PROT|nr:hypothetical protein [Denitrobaculum tricleocarpae]TQV83531.1 hypothetical protein FKG95_02775 [Denitrobaculum tricleocarpae]